MDERIIEILNAEKNKIKEHINTATILDLEKKISELKEILDNPNSLLNFNLEEIKKYLSEFEYANLEYLKQALGLEYFLITHNELERIKSIISNLLAKIKEDYQKEKNEIDKNTQKVQIIDNLLHNIQNVYNSGYLSSDDLKLLVNILNQYMDISEVNKIIGKLCILSINNVEKNNEVDENLKEEIQVAPETNIDINKLSEILMEYGYDINIIAAKNINILRKYGVFDNIRNILNILKENNIVIDSKEYQSQFCMILAHSDSEIVSNIINNIKEDIKNSKKDVLFQDIFINYLEYPSFFIRNTHAYGRRKSKDSWNDNEFEVGAYKNYLENRAFFTNLGLNMISVIKKSGKILLLPNKKILDNKKVFDTYHIPSQIYLSTLSCFNATNPAEAIDQFIELNCFEYLLQNFSRVIFKSDNLVFYRIIIANIRNIPAFMESNGKLKAYGYITSPYNNELGVSALNRSEMVQQYYPKEIQIFDSFINEEEFDNNWMMALNNYFIKKLDENYIYDEFSYDFHGVIISRYKVLRYYEMLIRKSQAGTKEALLYAICKNSILNEDEYNKIKTCVERLFNRGVNR